MKSLKKINFCVSKNKTSKIKVKSKKVEPGHSIGVTWDDFYVEDSSECLYDYVALYNGPTINFPEIGRYCGTSSPPDVHTANNFLTILFESDHSVAQDGWKLTWAADNSGCGNQVYI